jgi:PPP family 3-phenylpropionic acid transporter
MGAVVKSNVLVIPKLFYFCWFTALGVYAPFVTLYYRDRGLDLSQIGVLLALAGITQIVAGPLWGLLADTLHLHRKLLPVAIIGAVLPAALMGMAGTFGPILILAGIMAVFSVPVGPLSDTATLTLLGEQRDRYGAQRVWGAIGWGVSTIIAGAIVQRLGLHAIFWMYPIVGLIAMLVALRLPGAELVKTNVLGSARTLLRDTRWARFLFCALLIGCASSLMHGFLSIYLSQLGAGEEQIGLAYTLASLSEMPVMALAPIALRRWGPRPLLVCAGLAYALRLFILAIAPSPLWVLGAQLLHGLCFAALWTAGVYEAQRLAPPGLAATAQSLLSTAVFGIAVVIANIVGGVIYQNAGAPTLFGAAAALALAGAIGFMLPLQEREPAPIAAG